MKKLSAVGYWVGVVSLVAYLASMPPSPFAYLFIIPGIVAAFAGVAITEVAWRRKE